jgi:hypothetical protein
LGNQIAPTERTEGKTQFLTKDRACAVSDLLHPVNRLKGESKYGKTKVLITDISDTKKEALLT